MINGRSHLEYFTNEEDIETIGLPLSLTNSLQQFDVKVSVDGGGTSGQRDAIKLGLARALGNFVPGFGTHLARNGMMTRDSRIVERKKPGQRKARAKFQWVKR